MSKRSKGSNRANAKGASKATEAKLAHNPFGALAGLGNSLPQQQTPTSTDSTAEAPLSEPPIVERFPKKLVVRMEKKGRRGKTVTRIAGVPQRDLQALTSEMKKALGCGATVEGSEVILQGSLVDRAAAWLSKHGARQVVKGN